MATQVRAFLTTRNLAEEDVWACELALVEACNNAVKNTPPSLKNKEILLEIACETRAVEIRVSDHTGGFELPDSPRLPSAEAESGRGLYLMKRLMDQVRYIRGGGVNCLVMRKTVGVR